MTNPLTPKQKRAFNRASKAITELAKEAAHSEPLTALMLGLLTRSAGTMVGIGCAINEVPLADMRDVSDRVAAEVKSAALEAYTGRRGPEDIGKQLAEEAKG